MLCMAPLSAGCFCHTHSRQALLEKLRGQEGQAHSRCWGPTDFGYGVNLGAASANQAMAEAPANHLNV